MLVRTILRARLVQLVLSLPEGDFSFLFVIPCNLTAEWMELLRNREGQEAALAAAKQTGRLQQRDKEAKESKKSSLLVWLRNVFMWPGQFAKTSLIPFYQKGRKASKEQISHMLYGDSPFACNFRVTGVNLLVLCSTWYLFVEVIRHAFLPASWDYSLTVVTL